MQDIEKQSRLLIDKALALHASDIHFHPKDNETAVFFGLKACFISATLFHHVNPTD
ncbi:hypothetical protein [Sinobaca sp. H24]|uniref:hypothetical protein n=1 Tax=Sinobaca sp. H24 TaxID=2923376 RepID=UPI0020792592|nr:hypothetical protein [Sinobaca sp. H24]